MERLLDLGGRIWPSVFVFGAHTNTTLLNTISGWGPIVPSVTCISDLI